jgi:hypothetical protein
MGNAASLMGQSRRFSHQQTTSDLPLKAGIVRLGRHVSKGPTGDIAGLAK